MQYRPTGTLKQYIADIRDYSEALAVDNKIPLIICAWNAYVTVLIIKYIIANVGHVESFPHQNLLFVHQYSSLHIRRNYMVIFLR